MVVTIKEKKMSPKTLKIPPDVGGMTGTRFPNSADYPSGRDSQGIQHLID